MGGVKIGDSPGLIANRAHGNPKVTEHCCFSMFESQYGPCCVQAEPYHVVERAGNPKSLEAIEKPSTIQPLMKTLVEGFESLKSITY